MGGWGEKEKLNLCLEKIAFEYFKMLLHNYESLTPEKISQLKNFNDEIYTSFLIKSNWIIEGKFILEKLRFDKRVTEVLVAELPNTEQHTRIIFVTFFLNWQQNKVRDFFLPLSEWSAEHAEITRVSRAVITQ